VEALYQYGLFGVIGRLFVSYGLPTGIGLSLVFFGAAFWVARRRRRRTGAPARRPASSEVMALHRLLAAMDRKVRALGYRRDPGETLHAFAERIDCGLRIADCGLRESLEPDSPTAVRNPRLVATWYLRYAGLRYAPHVDPDQIQQLQQGLLGDA
jgi:hypothetical protein